MTVQYVKKIDEERDAVLEEYLDWALETFKDETIVQQAIHLVKETRELEHDPENLVEQADVLFMAVLIASRVLILAEEQGQEYALIEAMKKKLAVNKTRTWQRTEDGDYQHTEE